MRILFLGADSGTSFHRYSGFDRIGHEAHLIDPRKLLPGSAIIDQVEWRLSPGILEGWIQFALKKKLRNHTYDVAFVDNGTLIGPNTVRFLKSICKAVVNFNHDDPFGFRDRTRFSLYRRAVPLYDLIVVVRQENVVEAKELGARKILYTYRVADDVEHSPVEVSIADRERWQSDVAFIGTWMPERGPVLARLLELGVPLSIFGDRWQRAPEWPALKGAWRMPGLESKEYRLAVQCAKICIGLVSKGNRDQHTTRSMEIPALGSVFCAERTPEHLMLYQDGEEAVFWDSAEECASRCRQLLEDDVKRVRIALKGQQRFLRSQNTTDHLLRKILTQALE